MLPDVLTEGDNLEMPPMPDASLLLSQMDDESHLHRKRRAGSRDINLQDDLQGSQFLQNSIENRNFDDEDLVLDPMDDIDLGLDFGLDLDDMNVGGKNDRSIEIGRDAPAARRAENDILSELDIQVSSKEDFIRDNRDVSLNLDFGGDDGIRMVDDDGDVDMYGNIGDQPDVSALLAAPTIDRARISESPLSDVDAALVQEGERTFNNTDLYEQPEDETEPSIFRAPQRARKQKVLQMDSEIELSNGKIKEQQLNRDKITRPQSFLPRDPELLALMEMQKDGGFITNIMNDGRSSGWAPELQGMLSLAAIRKSGELKRKRDSGVADMGNEDQEGANKSPRLELGEDDDLAIGLGDAGLRREDTINADGTMMEMPGDDGFMLGQEDDDHNATAGFAGSPSPNFDQTTAPLVHPADSGPISLGTKHAVHLLRDRFGVEAANSPDKRRKASVLFQDLLPEATTSKADATKMFFEVLVLATKDAVKVEQHEALLGGPIRVRGKRGLWGDWAEREAGGEIEEEANAGLNSRLESAPAVAVAA